MLASDAENWDHSYTADKNVRWYSHSENSLTVFYKPKDTTK